MDFSEAQQKFASLKQQLAVRQITVEEFSARIALIRLQDGNGSWWQLSEDGKWLFWTGASWEMRLPPVGIPIIIPPHLSGSQPQKGTQAAPGAKSPPKTLVQLIASLVPAMIKAWFKNIPLMIVMSILIFVVHTFSVVYLNEGFGLDTTHPILSMVLVLKGNFVPGILFWTFLTGIGTSLMMQVFSSGFSKVKSDLSMIPSWVKESLNSSGALSKPLVLGCAAAPLFMGSILNNRLVSLQFCIIIIMSLMSRQQGLMAVVMPLAWSDAHRLFNRPQGIVFNQAWIGVCLLGALAGFGLAVILPFAPYLGVTGAIVLVGITVIFLNQKNKPSGGIIMFLSVMTLFFAWIAKKAYADDGGWKESGATLGGWLKSSGAVTAVGIGVPPTVGANVGVAVGVVIGSDIDIPEQQPLTEPASSPYGEGYDNATKDKKEALDEMQKIEKQWEDSELTADKNDPNYETMKKQYQDYMDYLKNKADAANAQANTIAQDAITKANTKVLHGQDGRDYTIVYDPKTGKWNNSETGNEFDPDRFDQWQKDLASDKEFSAKELDKMSNRQDDFSKRMDQMVNEQKEKQAAVDELTRIGKAAMDHDMWNPGGPGDVYGKTHDMINDIYSGKPIDKDSINQVREVVGDRITGKTADESILRNPENQDRISNALEKAGSDSLQTIITGQDAEGNTSWTALGARLVAGIATGGASEAGFIGGKVIYAEHEAIDNGASDLGAAWAGLKTGATEGLAIAAGHLIPAAGAKFFPNVTAGIGEMLEPIAKGVAATDSAVQKGSKALGDRISKIFNPLPESLTGTRAAVTRVLESGSSTDLAKLYSQDGMKKLAELQKAGHLSADEAKILNSRLSTQVNKNIDNATKNTIDQFEANNAVKVDRSVLGDSGSSAKSGGNPKAKTDFDRTSVTKFNKEDLQNYAKAKGLSVEQANNELQDKFSKSLTNNVDNHLRSSGFARGANDVDYKTYTGIGKSAGQADAYPPGFTGSRQAVQGNGVQWERGANGELAKHNISGQAVVDQHGLNVNELTGKLPPDPTKFHAGEFRDFSEQQVKSAAEHSDVKSLAKAMGRQNDLANRMDNMATSPSSSHFNELANENLPVAPPRMDPKVADVASQINSNPSNALKILENNGYTEKTFAGAVRKNINGFNAGLKR